MNESLATLSRPQRDVEKHALIVAHPDLAGRLALAKKLTAGSANEQGAAGFDRLTTEDLERFTALEVR